MKCLEIALQEQELKRKNFSMKNKESTRYASSVQETRIAKKFDGRISSNSGASMFSGSDVYLEDASLCIECKTCMKPSKSFSIKKEWIEKNKDEAFRHRFDNHCIAFNFDYTDTKDYYVIDDKLMLFLIKCLASGDK